MEIFGISYVSSIHLDSCESDVMEMFCFCKSFLKSKRWIKLDYYSCQDCENVNGYNPRGPIFGNQNCLDGSAGQKIKKPQGWIRIETIISKMAAK